MYAIPPLNKLGNVFPVDTFVWNKVFVPAAYNKSIIIL
jgi:hypothetical protein